MKLTFNVKIFYYLLWVLIAILFFPVFSMLYQTRWDSLGYAHAFFILPVSLWFVYRKKEELSEAFATTEKKFGAGSLIIFLLGGAMYAFGWQQDYMVVSTFAVIPFLYGFIGFLYGRQVQKLVLFPILYLLLLVPPPFAILDRITLPLRYLSAFAVERSFQLFKVPITREGLSYVIMGEAMMIDEACSGFRSLITMFSLGLAYVYVTDSKLIKKAALVASIVPLSIIGNIIRIIIVSLLAAWFGAELAQGFMHSFSGIIVFLFIVLGFIAIETFWSKFSKRGSEEKNTDEFDWFE